MLAPNVKRPAKTRAKKKPSAEEELLSIARKRFAAAASAATDNRKTYVEDVRFSCAEDQWDPEVKRARGAHRPALTINRLNGIIKSIIGDYRQNKMSVKVLPASGEASEDIADVLAGLIRNIEAHSDADVAYTNGLECSTRGGFGGWRILTQYTGDDAFEQDLVIRPIHNPLTIYFDPAARLITREDARYCFITEIIPKDQFEAEYPDAEAVSFEADGDARTEDWLSDDGVRVAEYYEKVTYPARLVALSNGMVVEITDEAQIAAFAELGLTVVRERTAQRTKVIWRKLTGNAVLETREYFTKYIPIVPVIGEEINIEGKVHLRGAIFYAKDPQRLLNYWRSTATETVALAPKAPWLVTPAQTEGFEDQWDNANHTPLSRLYYNPEAGVPPPQRVPAPETPVAEISMAMNASDDIKATTGLYDASLGSRGNETSGRAIMARQKEGDTSSFLFLDNLKKAIEYSGRILLDLIPTVYDTERVVRVLDLEGKPQMRPINQERRDPLTGVTEVLNSVTVGKYDVVIDAGPSFASLRQEAQSAMVQLAQAYPPLMQVAGDLVVEGMDLPGTNKVAERLRRSMPPQITTDPDSPEGQAMAQQTQGQEQQVPPEVQAQAAEAERQQQEFAAKMELENRKFAFDQLKAQKQFELQEKQMLTDATLKERQMQTAHETEMKKHTLKLAVEQETGNRMAEAAAKPTTTLQLNAQDAFAQVAETMVGMAAQQAEATQGLVQVAVTLQQGMQQQAATLEQALTQNTQAVASGMAQSADAMREVAQAVAGQTAATQQQTQVLAAPRVAVRDEDGNLIGAEVQL